MFWRRTPRLSTKRQREGDGTGGIVPPEQRSSCEAPPKETVPEINWDEKLREGEGWLKDFDNENPVLKDLGARAKEYMEAARIARELSMPSQIECNLGMLNNLWQSIPLELYLADLKNMGILLEPIAGSYTLINWDPSIGKAFVEKPFDLATCAACMKIAELFPQLDVQYFFIKTNEQGKQWAYTCTWAFRIAAPGIAERIFISPKQLKLTLRLTHDKTSEIRMNEDGSLTVLMEEQRRPHEDVKQDEWYKFSRADLKPFALAPRMRGEKRFIMPDIVRSFMKGIEVNTPLPHVFAAALLAGSLGMEEVTKSCAEELLREKLVECLLQQGIPGAFIPIGEERNFRFTPLIPVLRQVYFPVELQFFTWLQHVRSASVKAVSPDLEQGNFEECLVIGQSSSYYGESKLKEARFFLRFGAWLYECKEVPLSGDLKRKIDGL